MGIQSWSYSQAEHLANNFRGKFQGHHAPSVADYGQAVPGPRSCMEELNTGTGDPYFELGTFLKFNQEHFMSC